MPKSKYIEEGTLIHRAVMLALKIAERADRGNVNLTKQMVKDAKYVRNGMNVTFGGSHA